MTRSAGPPETELLTSVEKSPAGAFRRLARQSTLYGLAGGLSRALGLVTVPILTRLLTPAEYGVADLAFMLAAMMVLLSRFAGDIPTARSMGIAADAGSRRTILSSFVWTTVLTSAGVALILLPFAPVIAASVLEAPSSGVVVVLALALIPLSAAQGAMAQTQRLQAHPGAFAVLATIDLFSQGILAVVFVVLGWGPLGVIAGYVLGSLIGLAAAAVYIRPIILTLPDARLARAMVLEGIAFLPAALGFVIANNVVRYLLVAADGQGAVGLFGVAVRVAGALALVTGAFSMAWGPFGLALPHTPQTARLFGGVLRGFAWMATFVSLGIAAIAPELITLISGPLYVRAATMLPGLLVSTAMSGSFYVLLVAAGVGRRGGAVAYAAVLGAAVQIIATAALLPFLDLAAVGAGSVLGQAVGLLLLVRAVRTSVLRGYTSVLILCAGGAAAIALQQLNTVADSTLTLRWLIAAGAIIAGGWMAKGLIRQIELA